MKIGLPLIVVGILLVIGSIAGYGYMSVATYDVYKDTDSWMHQAAIAPTAQDKAIFLQKAKDGLAKHNLTTGYNEWWFPTPSNDMSVKVAQIDNTIAYANEVGKIDKNAFNAYASAWEILENKTHDLASQTNAVGAFTVKTGLWVVYPLLAFMFFFGIIFLIVGFLIKMEEY